MDLQCLMIGDWVCYKEDTEYSNPVKVSGVDLASGKLVTSDRKDDSVDADDIIPIPLTEKVFEDNATCFCCDFKFFQIGSIAFYKNLEGKFVVATKYVGLYGIDMEKIIEIEYVHELQNVLKVCNIDKEISL